MRYPTFFSFILLSLLVVGCSKDETEPSSGGATSTGAGSISRTDESFVKLKQSAYSWVNQTNLDVTALFDLHRLEFTNELYMAVPADSVSFKKNYTNKTAQLIVNGVYKTYTRENRAVMIEEFLPFSFDIINRFVDTPGGRKIVSGQIKSSYMPSDVIY